MRESLAVGSRLLPRATCKGSHATLLRIGGRSQNEAYKRKLLDCLERLSSDRISGKHLKEIDADLFVRRCEHHYIFYLKEHVDPAEIIAVFHEKMDLMNRLKKRL